MRDEFKAGLTDDQRSALELIRASERVILTGHVRPDGDCIGAQAAFSRVLAALGKEVHIINPDPPEDRYDYLAEHCEYGSFGGGELPPHDLAVLLDCSELSRTGDLGPVLAAAPSKKLVVDHHIHNGEEWWDEVFADVRASATGLLVYRIADALGVELDDVAARGVFTSIVTDTGWLKYSNTDEETALAFARLVGRGVQPSELYGAIFQRRDPEHPRLVGDLLARLEYHADGRLAVIDLPSSDDARDALDADDALDLLRSVGVVEVVLFFREIQKGTCKVSARSKTDYNVSAMLGKFGGGGHAKAAGATLELDLETARRRVIEVALEGFERR